MSKLLSFEKHAPSLLEFVIMLYWKDQIYSREVETYDRNK